MVLMNIYKLGLLASSILILTACGGGGGGEGSSNNSQTPTNPQLWTVPGLSETFYLS